MPIVIGSINRCTDLISWGLAKDNDEKKKKKKKKKKKVLGGYYGRVLGFIIWRMRRVG